MMNSLLFILLSVAICNVNGDTFGNPAESKDAKYVAAIFHNSAFICTGSIINPTFILTAGHCLSRKDVTKLHVVAGALLVERLTGSSVKQVFIHPQFARPFPDSDLAEHDIGLIELDHPLTFGDAVNSILVSSKSGPEYRLNCKQVLYRVRRTCNGPVAELRYSNVVVTELNDCKKFYFDQLFDNQMCIFNIWKTRNPLPGDSGSPTICGGKVFGVLSSGLKTSEVRGPAKIYMAAPYMDWILQTAYPTIANDFDLDFLQG